MIERPIRLSPESSAADFARFAVDSTTNQEYSVSAVNEWGKSIVHVSITGKTGSFSINGAADTVHALQSQAVSLGGRQSTPFRPDEGNLCETYFGIFDFGPQPGIISTLVKRFSGRGGS